MRAKGAGSLKWDRGRCWCDACGVSDPRVRRRRFTLWSRAFSDAGVSAAGASRRGPARGPRGLRPRRPPRLEVAGLLIRFVVKASLTCFKLHVLNRTQSRPPRLEVAAAGCTAEGSRQSERRQGAHNRPRLGADSERHAAAFDSEPRAPTAPSPPAPPVGSGGLACGAYSGPHVPYPSQRPASSSRRASQIRPRSAARRGEVDARASRARASTSGGGPTQVLAM